MADAAREIENLLYTYAERIGAGDFAGLAFPRITVTTTAGAIRV